LLISYNASKVNYDIATYPRAARLSGLIDYPQLLFLGAFAGFTIFLGLPLAVAQGVSRTKKGFLNAFAVGILIFLIVDVLGHAWESTADAANSAFVTRSPVGNALLDLLAMFGGLAIGLLGLTWYGTRYMKTSMEGQQKQELQLAERANAYRMSTLIAAGIGVHNFSEGLAIGQSYVSGAMSLAIVLVIGFAAHNATEGFGIASPLTGLSKRPSIRFIILVGLVGGGPTFVGTLVGSLWTSAPLYVFFLAFAGGALIYVTLLMYNSGRRQSTNEILMIGICAGLCAGFITDLIITLGGA
jgi:ZIP family zinc transporter